MVTKFTNAYVLTMDKGTCYQNGCVVTDGSAIVHVGASVPAQYAGAKEVDCKGDILMPGLVNAHAHLGMSLFRCIAEGQSVQEWLTETIFPREERLTYEDVLNGTMLSLMECARGGVTTVADTYFFNEASFEAAKASGMRTVLLGADMDIKKSTADVLKKVKQDIDRYNGKEANITCLPGAHSVYTCSERLLAGVADIAAANRLPAYIHLSETLKEVGDCTQVHGDLTPPQYLHKMGYFAYGGIAAHCVHTDKDDIALLEQSGVSAVHCPASNLKLGSGIAPVYAMTERGLNVALGTDSSASNNALDMFREMYLASVLQKGVMNKAEAIPPKLALEMATVNGAKALSLGNTGMLKTGYCADIIRVSAKEPHFYPQSDKESTLVYAAKSSDVVMTMSGGKVLYENGKYYLGFVPNFVIGYCKKFTKNIK